MRWLQAQSLQADEAWTAHPKPLPAAGLGELICADVENGPWPLPGRQFRGRGGAPTTCGALAARRAVPAWRPAAF